MQQISIRTERKTQLVDITEQVQAALEGSNGAAAALVYVPHTTAGSEPSLIVTPAVVCGT